MSALQLYVFLQVAVNRPKSLFAHTHTFLKKNTPKLVLRSLTMYPPRDTSRCQSRTKALDSHASGTKQQTACAIHLSSS